ncbi:MAG TPA: cupredoxin domain-containing protein, partial [Acidimicrobiales bacterium]|nr:cupredoxin domain-containing protein [Acidimicrobiales bacterium]
AEPAAEPADTGHAADPPAPAADVAGKAVIEIEMVDYAYAPDTVDIRAGVPVVFRFTNTGNVPHEAMVGDMHQQEEFEAEGDHDADDGHHGDVMAVMVQPGETADLEVVVAEPGTTYMACHIPGHYERGQIATINVAA